MNTYWILIYFLSSLVISTPSSLPWTNICNNGHDPSKNSKKIILEQFAKGPCAPVLLLPGIGGSNLQLKIDCPKFKQAHPKTFALCGWDSCDGNPALENSSTPKKEYQIWIPHMLSPMSFFTSFEKNKQCFAGLISLEYIEEGNKLKVKTKEGISISPVGTTPETHKKDSSDCGMNAVINLIPDIPNPSQTAYYVKIKQRFEEMGYVSGLTMQALPFDFRLDNENDPASSAISQIMDSMFHLVNKKIVIIGHSMGNHRIANYLWNTPQIKKDKLIKQYIAIAPVLLGAAETNKHLICGADDLSFGLNIGVDFLTYKATLAEFSSIFQILPNDCYLSQKDQPWMKKIIERIKYESGESDDPVFDWMPKRDEICYPRYPNFNNCMSGLADYQDYGTVQGQPINAGNLREIIEKYSFSQLKSSGWKVIQDDFIKLPNIGVPSSVVYSTRVGSDGGQIYPDDPRQFTSQNQFCTRKHYERIKLHGDETVPATSAVTPFVKWAWEFEQGQGNSYPVKFVDICSDKNQRFTPYDQQDGKGVWEMTKNEYQGVPCNCKAGKIKDCTHIGMLMLDGLHDYLMSALKTEQTTTLNPDVQAMTNAEIENMIQNCDMLYTAFNPSKHTRNKVVADS